MKQKFLMVMLCMLAAFPTFAADSEPGSSCSNPIVLNKEDGDFNFNVTKAGTVWFAAWTFDLPMKVCFTPSNPELPAPDVEMDFTCKPGVYEDPILCSLFCPNSSTGVEFDLPYKVKLSKEGNSYCASFGKTYRDLLLKQGISYNVEVFVKVVFKSAGSLELLPDTEFADCMDGGKFIRLGDTIHIKANDKERYVVMPFIQWREDSIRLVWEGDSPATFAFASTCQFDPTNIRDPNTLDRIYFKAPEDSAKYSSSEITYYAEYENAQAGMHYGRVFSESDGVLTIKRVPMAPPDGDAVLLKNNRTVTIMAKDSMALFALHRDTLPLRFDTPTDRIFKMYIGLTADFTPSTAIASYQFDVTDKGHSLFLRKSEVKALWDQTTGSYLYVRFWTGARTNLTPSVWKLSECSNKCDRLRKGDTYIQPKSYGYVYHRLYYPEWKDGDMTFSWNGSKNCVVWVYDSCEFVGNNPSTTDPHYVQGGQLKSYTGTLTFAKETIAGWENRVDAEGNLYVTFVTADAGTVNIVSNAPEETDPVDPAATISVECKEGTNSLIVRVSEAQQIVIKNMQGNEVKKWNAVVGTPETVTIPAGSYNLSGAHETMLIHVP